MAAASTVYETATAKYFDRKLTSQIAFNSPEFFKLYEKANTRLSGRKFVWEPRYARRSLTWFGRYGSHERNPLEHYREAELPVARCIASAMLDQGDVSMNTGRQKIIEMLSEELAALKDDVVYGMGAKLWNGNGELQLTGLETALTTSAGTYAGISQSTDSWWDTNRVNADGEKITLDMITQGELAAHHGTDKPDLFVTDRIVWRQLYNVAVSAHRIVTPATKEGKRLADLGFEVIEVNGKPTVWSDHVTVGASAATAGYLYGLNTKDIQFRFVPGMKMKRTKWKELESQPLVIACDMINICTLIVKTPRNHFVIYGIKES